jgi:hypothetical protein
MPGGKTIRLRQKLLKATGIRVTSQMTMEAEGSERSATMADNLSIVYG